jgi:ketopantoate hydroxymethyltransferase
MVGTDVQEDSGLVSSFYMALNIKDASTDRLVRRLAEVTGESITDAVARWKGDVEAGRFPGVDETLA